MLGKHAKSQGKRIEKEMGLWVRKNDHLIANGWPVAQVAPRVLVSPLMMTGERTALTLVHRFKLPEARKKPSLSAPPPPRLNAGPAVSRLGRQFM